MTAHALLSASGAHRWLKCPPSAQYEATFKDSGSVYAAEGTLAHALGEYYLRAQVLGRSDPVALDQITDDALYSSEMDRYAQGYADYVEALYLSSKSATYIDIERRVSYADYVPEGFGTCDCVLVRDGHELNIIDLKYGKGVPVSAEDNPQLMLYALGALAEVATIFAIDTVAMHIYQPRLDNISTWAIPTDDLLAFGARVKPIAQLAYQGGGDFCPGDHCRFCRARAVCRARADDAVRLAGFTSQDPRSLSLEEYGDYITKGQNVAEWLKDVEAHALKRLLAGESIPGYKAVEGRANRRIKDDGAFAARLIEDGYDEALIYRPRTLETLTALEKLVGKKEFGKYDDFIERPAGKPTLVKESDKRPAINTLDTIFKED